MRVNKYEMIHNETGDNGFYGRHGASDNGSQEIFDLVLAEGVETLCVTDAYLDVVLAHLAFKALLERQDGRVHGVLYLDVLVVPANSRL